MSAVNGSAIAFIVNRVEKDVPVLVAAVANSGGWFSRPREQNEVVRERVRGFTPSELGVVTGHAPVIVGGPDRQP
jgi:hypothetical protein